MTLLELLINLYHSLHVRRLTSKHKYLASNIIAMDETAVWVDMVANTTVDDIGTRSVSLKTTGHEKVRVSVCLSAKADGTKLKPMIVFGGAKRESKALNEEFKSRCVVASSKNAWMNEELTLVWAEKVLGKFSFGRRLLSWDSFECHMMDSVKEAVKTSNSDLVIVPGGCTKYIQAPDVCWNKPFKEFIGTKYDHWMAEGVHQYTEAGNMKPPPRKKIVQWILESWAALSKEVIVESFKSCALNLANDGSEDERIHCFKPKEPCHAGRQQLKSQLSVLDKRNRDNPFENITDSDVENAVDDLNIVDASYDENDIDIEI